jgi:hypothetical protein
MRTFLRLALKAHLYVDGWSFRRWFKAWLASPPVVMNTELKSIVLAFDNEVPVGICILYEMQWKTVVSFFVKPEYRRKQIATNMFKKLRVDSSKEITFLLGDRGSPQLFKSLGARQTSLYEYRK